MRSRQRGATAVAIPTAIPARRTPSIPVLAASAIVLGGLLLVGEAQAQSTVGGTTEQSSSGQSSGQGMSAESGVAPMNAQDRLFIEKAGPANESEIEMGRLAIRKSETPAIKEFGRWMTSAHSTADSELRILAQNMHMPAPPNKLDATHKSEYETLEKLNGKQFEQQYLQAQVKAHHQAITLFQQEASKGKNKWLTTFATTLEPELHHHLAEAEDLLKTETGSGS